MKMVVFAYTHSAIRAQTAATLFNQMSNQGLAKAVTAYVATPTQVPTNVEKLMYEHALDVSAVGPPLQLTQHLAEQADTLIVIDDASSVRGLAIAPQEDWSPGEPPAEEGNALATLYAELRPRVWKLIARHGWWKLQPLGSSKRRAHA